MLLFIECPRTGVSEVVIQMAGNFEAMTEPTLVPGIYGGPLANSTRFYGGGGQDTGPEESGWSAGELAGLWVGVSAGVVLAVVVVVVVVVRHRRRRCHSRNGLGDVQRNHYQQQPL